MAAKVVSEGTGKFKPGIFRYGFGAIPARLAFAE
jgi:hypothetical protein